MNLKSNIIKKTAALVALIALAFPLLPAQPIDAAVEFEWVKTAEGTPTNVITHDITFEDRDASQLPKKNAEYVDNMAHGGVVSLHLIGSEDSSVDVAYKTSSWRDEKRAIFDFSVWVKAANLAGTNKGIVISSFNTGVDDVIIANPTGEWQEVKLPGCTMGDEDKVWYFTIGFTPGTTGDLWVDDITLKKVRNPYEREFIMVEHEFADVPKGFWARDNILNLFNNGIVTGKTDTEFCPGDNITREEFAKIAVMASCNVKSKKTGSFSDVASGSWYEPYVETAAAENLVNGMGNGSFGVGIPVTRQDAAVVLDRIMTNKGIYTEGNSKDFADKNEIAEYAKDAVTRLSAAGYIGGDESGKFNPTSPITRAEVCAIIDRMSIIENRNPDLLYRMMPEEADPIGEHVYEQNFDSVENIAGNETLTSLFCKDDGNRSNGCIAITNEQYDTIVFDIPKGLNRNNWSEREGVLTYTISVKSELNSDAEITFTPSVTLKSTGAVRKGSAVTVTGSTDGWITKKITMVADTFISAQVVVKIENATSGNVYFDDLSMYSPVYPLQAGLLTPNYKGLIYDENGENKGESDIILQTWVRSEYMKEKEEDALLRAEILDKENFIVLSSENDIIQTRMNVTFSSKYLDYGDYILKVSLISKIDGREIDSVSTILRKRQGSITDLKTYIDENGVLIKDGKPKLVIAAYVSASTDLERDGSNGVEGLGADSPIDIALDTWGGYDSMYTNSECEAIRESDVNLFGTARFITSSSSYYIDSIPEERTHTERVVRAHQDNDRMFGWYLDDEPNAYLMRDKLNWHHEIISSIDLERPIYMADNKWTEHNGFSKNFAVDALGEDQYTISKNHNDTGIGKQAPMVKALRKGFLNKPIWHFLQMYNANYNYGNSDPTWQAPSELQQSNMFMQSLCSGATGITWYIWSSHYINLAPGVEPVDVLRQRTLNVSEFYRKYEDIIMSQEEAPAVASTGGDWLHYMTKRYNGKSYLFMCNSTIDTHSASFMLEGATSAYNLLTGESYKVDEEGIFDIELDNIEVAILEIEQPDYLSPDSEIRNIAFYSGDQSFMVREMDDGLIVDVPNGVENLSYNVFCNDKATLYVNNVESDKTGVVPGDTVTFRLVSEDEGYSETVKVTINKR